MRVGGGACRAPPTRRAAVVGADARAPLAQEHFFRWVCRPLTASRPELRPVLMAMALIQDICGGERHVPSSAPRPRRRTIGRHPKARRNSVPGERADQSAQSDQHGRAAPSIRWQLRWGLAVAVGHGRSWLR
jgi:hypothetical protein